MCSVDATMEVTAHRKAIYLGQAHESVQEGSRQEEGLLVQLILTGHLHQPADDNRAHGLVNVDLWLVIWPMIVHVVWVN